MGNPIVRRIAVIAGSSALLLLTACGSVSELTKQQVARSETAVTQAQAAVGSSEAGAIELQQAKETLSQAQNAIQTKDETQAQRLAAVAELDAQLAIAKSQSAASRKAADDVLASIETLKREADRSAVTK
ncbi:MAG TPA: DUF4398 domain-containing protein [Steroidobacteraceae bacterium]|jgi:hypothetical protein